MSSRAFRRLQQTGDVIKIKADKREDQKDDLGIEDTPAFVSNARKKDKNPFALVRVMVWSGVGHCFHVLYCAFKMKQF